MTDPATAPEGEAVLKLKWRRTWPDNPDDYVGVDPKHGNIGRIYRYTTGGRDYIGWFWTMYASGAGISRPAVCSGYAGTPREAASKVEGAWELSTRLF